MNLPMASGFPMMAGMGDFDGAESASDEDGDPVKRLRKLISERQAETTEILRSWMEDRGERT
jgi:flagellar M-ring protein FliF